MGNCQAVDAAALVIQHPSGKQERMYWTITASEVMKLNPGHYVSLIIPLPFPGGGQENSDDQKTVRYTRVKLLRPSDNLVLGRAYRLVTTQEVMKVIRAKKHARSKRNQSESGENIETNSERCITSSEYEAGESAPQKNNQQDGPNHGGHLYKAFLSSEAEEIYGRWSEHFRSIFNQKTLNLKMVEQ